MKNSRLRDYHHLLESIQARQSGLKSGVVVDPGLKTSESWVQTI